MTPTIWIQKPEHVLKRDSDEEFVFYDEHQVEKILWSARPSDVRFIWIYIICSFTFWLVIPLLVMFFLHIHNHSVKYVLTNERLRICSGIFIRRIVDLELYRIKDISIILPFYMRAFGLGSLELRTSDASNPYVLIEAVPHISKLEEMIRFYVEKRRDVKKVQEVDQYRFQ